MQTHIFEHFAGFAHNPGYVDHGAMLSQFMNPKAVCTRGGMVIVADLGNNRLRTLTRHPVVVVDTLVLADGTVHFDQPCGLCVAHDGGIMVLLGTGAILRIDPALHSCAIVAGNVRAHGTSKDGVGTAASFAQLVDMVELTADCFMLIDAVCRIRGLCCIS